MYFCSTWHIVRRYLLLSVEMPPYCCWEMESMSSLSLNEVGYLSRYTCRDIRVRSFPRVEFLSCIVWFDTPCWFFFFYIENNIVLSSLFSKCARYSNPEQTDKVVLPSYNTPTEPQHTWCTAFTNEYTSWIMNENSLKWRKLFLLYNSPIPLSSYTHTHRPLIGFIFPLRDVIELNLSCLVGAYP